MPDPISWSLAGPYFMAALIFGYLAGSIPFGLIMTRLFRLGDLRQVGSGNIGATNVLRTGNKLAAILTLFGDGLKGTAAVLLAARWGPDTAVIAGLGAFLGHCFPVWLKFRGGKGVATFLGILLALHWPTMILTALIWLATAAISRYSSLSALIASAAAPLILYAWGHVQFAELCFLLSIILWFRHKSNIQRLISGKESRIGAK
ncbi:MAG: glycerol-3-phosphate 1-O-acyltransferase PlsY [Hyphomicrobiales bacterium]|nr:glycerol-3-phosphate 1-O-acyltransferase PlsY [Hyphomicrobiales bacterium]